MDIKTVLEAYFTGNNSSQVLKDLLGEVATELECPMYTQEGVNCGECVKCKAQDLTRILEDANPC